MLFDACFPVVFEGLLGLDVDLLLELQAKLLLNMSHLSHMSATRSYGHLRSFVGIEAVFFVPTCGTQGGQLHAGHSWKKEKATWKGAVLRRTTFFQGRQVGPGRVVEQVHHSPPDSLEPQVYTLRELCSQRFPGSDQPDLVMSPSRLFAGILTGMGW